MVLPLFRLCMPPDRFITGQVAQPEQRQDRIFFIPTFHAKTGFSFTLAGSWKLFPSKPASHMARNPFGKGGDRDVSKEDVGGGREGGVK